jgi:broad specificity phosphatase PhoE
MKWQATGWGADLAPLSTLGRGQIQDCVPGIVAKNPEVLLCSPTTRTMEGGAILQAVLNLPLHVEFDMHEWVPDRSFAWATLADVHAQVEDLEKHGGEWPSGRELPWEPFSAIRARCLGVLGRYRSYSCVVVMCHEMVIRALTGKAEVKNGEIVEFIVK